MPCWHYMVTRKFLSAYDGTETGHLTSPWTFRSHIGTKEKPYLSALAPMIRLGRKYEIACLRDEGLARLKREFPTTLEEYDRLPDDYTNFTFPPARRGLDAIVDIINLALESNIQSILPAVYLHATAYPLVRFPQFNG